MFLNLNHISMCLKGAIICQEIQTTGQILRKSEAKHIYIFRKVVFCPSTRSQNLGIFTTHPYTVQRSVDQNFIYL